MSWQAGLRPAPSVDSGGEGNQPRSHTMIPVYITLDKMWPRAVLCHKGQPLAPVTLYGGLVPWPHSEKDQGFNKPKTMKPRQSSRIVLCTYLTPCNGIKEKERKWSGLIVSRHYLVVKDFSTPIHSSAQHGLTHLRWRISCFKAKCFNIMLPSLWLHHPRLSSALSGPLIRVAACSSFTNLNSSLSQLAWGTRPPQTAVETVAWTEVPVEIPLIA